MFNKKSTFSIAPMTMAAGETLQIQSIVGFFAGRDLLKKQGERKLLGSSPVVLVFFHVFF